MASGRVPKTHSILKGFIIVHSRVRERIVSFVLICISLFKADLEAVFEPFLRCLGVEPEDIQLKFRELSD